MDARAASSTGKWSPPQDASDIVKSVHAMLHPRNIVLVGATDKPGNYAERIWNNLVKYGYEGGLYPVNAKRETIWGVPCYKDFASLPDKPDHVLVLVPARFAVQVIRDAAAAGARSATIVTSGFSELQDEESQRLAEELKQAVKETGLAVTGPNCLGNLSAGEKLFTNIDDRIVTMEQGRVGIAGQSGAIVMAIRQALECAGVTGRDGAVIDHVELMGPAMGAGNQGRNFVLCPGRAYDRSPCGTGTSAKLACLAADGQLAPGARWRQESVLGSVFEAHYRMDGARLMPSIVGQAHVCAETSLLIDPADPYAWGVTASA